MRLVHQYLLEGSKALALEGVATSKGLSESHLCS